MIYSSIWYIILKSEVPQILIGDDFPNSLYVFLVVLLFIIGYLSLSQESINTF